MNNSANKGSTCWACTEPIKSGQVKCIKCSSWQNWRRILSDSNTTLALLVALTALFPMLSESVRTAFLAWNPTFSASILGELHRDNVSEGRYEFEIIAVAENTGTETLVIATYLDCDIFGDQRNLGEFRMGLTKPAKIDVGESAEIGYFGELSTESNIEQALFSCHNDDYLRDGYRFVVSSTMPRLGSRSAVSLIVTNDLESSVW